MFCVHVYVHVCFKTANMPPLPHGFWMGHRITMARNGPVPSARAWQQAEFSLDGSRDVSEWSVCTSVEVLKESTRD